MRTEQFSGKTANQTLDLLSSERRIKKVLLEILDPNSTIETIKQALLERLTENGVPGINDPVNPNTNPKVQKIIANIDNVAEELKAENQAAIEKTQWQIERNDRLLAGYEQTAKVLEANIQELKASGDATKIAMAEKINTEKLAPLQKQINSFKAQIEKPMESARELVTKAAEDIYCVDDLKKSKNELAAIYKKNTTEESMRARTILNAVDAPSALISTQVLAAIQSPGSSNVTDQLMESTQILNNQLAALDNMRGLLANPNVDNEQKKEFEDHCKKIDAQCNLIAAQLNDDATGKLLETHATEQGMREELLALTLQLQALQKAVSGSTTIPELASDETSLGFFDTVKNKFCGEKEITAAEMGTTFTLYETNLVHDQSNPNAPGKWVRTAVKPPLDPTREEILATIAKHNGPEGEAKFKELKAEGRIPPNAKYSKARWGKDGVIKFGYKAMRDWGKENMAEAQKQRLDRPETITTSPVATDPAATAPGLVPAQADGAAKDLMGNSAGNTLAQQISSDGKMTI